MVKTSEFRFPKSFIRDLVPYLSKAKKEGIVDKDCLNWCTLPLLTYFDNGIIPDGIMDITHPSIVYIPAKWNGFTHWLAATPYPQSLPGTRLGAIFENTCIFYTNSEGIYHPFTYTPIKRNPIIKRQEAGYNSDPDLFFDLESKILFCITRKRCGPDYITKIVIQKSKDGQTWSDPEPIINLKSEEECLSPCLIKYKNKYRVYVFQDAADSMKTTLSVDIWESSNLSDPNFSLYKKCKWHSTINIWHGGLFEYKNKLYLVGCGTKKGNVFITGQRDISKYLYLGVSTDGENFSMFSKPILRTNGVYRASAFIDEKDTFVCYVSLHNRYKRDAAYPAGNRIAVFEYPFNNLLDKLLS
jgi:hypothetical protein